MSNLSRAYRVNLNVLALVALLTGGFIVFATMSLAAVRQQQEMALLFVLGAPPAIASARCCGRHCWSASGVRRSAWRAAWPSPTSLLNTIGGDLGGGYFSSAPARWRRARWRSSASACWAASPRFSASLAPARAARHLPAAQVLKAGSQEATLARFRHRRIALAWQPPAGAAAAAAADLGLPFGAYLAIAALLFAGISLVPAVIRRRARRAQALASLPGCGDARSRGWR